MYLYINYHHTFQENKIKMICLFHFEENETLNPYKIINMIFIILKHQSFSLIHLFEIFILFVQMEKKLIL